MNGKVDHTALRVNQTCIITLLALALLFDWWWLVAAVGAVMLIGTWWPNAGLFKLFYARLLKPAGLLKPDLVVDEPQPHLFAQGVGALFLAVSTLALLAGAALLGWVLAGIVIALAAVNLFAGFCVGCFLYFQLARRGIHLTLPGWQQG
jgi:hypothetical protein